MCALIVDDDETSCQLLEKILKSKGMEAEWTTDSLAGYNISRHHHYDLFILDVRMPLLLGTDFTYGDLVPVGHHILNGDVDIGERRADQGQALF